MVAKGNEMYCAFSLLGFDEGMNVHCDVQNDCGIALAGPPKFFKQLSGWRFQVEALAGPPKFFKQLSEWRFQVEFHTLPCRKHDGANIDLSLFCMYACRNPPRNNHLP